MGAVQPLPPPQWSPGSHSGTWQPSGRAPPGAANEESSLRNATEPQAGQATLLSARTSSSKTSWQSEHANS